MFVCLYVCVRARARVEHRPLLNTHTHTYTHIHTRHTQRERRAHTHTHIHTQSTYIDHRSVFELAVMSYVTSSYVIRHIILCHMSHHPSVFELAAMRVRILLECVHI